MAEYVQEARNLFPKETHRLICVYTRKPNSEKKVSYLSLFDEVYTLDSLPINLAEIIEVVTCTQERDMETYIELLRLVSMIDEPQANLWTRAINKRLFKETMREIEPSIVPFVLPFDKDDRGNSIEYPAVIKPTNLTGSSFVAVVRNKDELNQYLKDIGNYESAARDLGRSPELVVEEFVSGPQYSMNVYIDKGGKIVYCPIIRVIPAFEIGISDTYSAIQYNTILKEDEMESLRRTISTIVTAFRLKGTSAHFDCILSTTGWRVCEVGLRIGGNRQQLFLLSHGFSHFSNDLYNRVGKEVNLGTLKNTVAIVQKAPYNDNPILGINYRAKRAQGIYFHLDKLTDSPEKSSPVSKGGATVFRAFLAGEKEEMVIAEAKELFESVSFKSV